MTRRRIACATLLGLSAVAAGVALAQPWEGGRGYRSRYSRGELPADRAGVPDWEVNESFKNDVFTFVRVEYDSYGGRGRWGGGCWTDFPDSDLNFSYRLQQLTSLKVNPDPISLRLTDERIFDHPFLYMIEPGALYFSDEEVVALRRYLLNGGFMMVDDFWGDYEYENFREQMKRVFPDKEPARRQASHGTARRAAPAPLHRELTTAPPAVPPPHSTHWFTKSGALLPGRLAEDSRTAYRTTSSATGTFRTTSWNSSTSLPSNNGWIGSASREVVCRTTATSSSSGR